jgi:hypothetical protein
MGSVKTLAGIALFVVAGTLAVAGEDRHPLVEALRQGDESAVGRLLALGEKPAGLVAQLEQVMGERPGTGKGLLPQAVLAARVLAGLGAGGRAALARALGSGNPQAVVAAAGAVVAMAADLDEAERRAFVGPLRAALRLTPDEDMLQLHWHPWQPLYRRAPDAAVEALGALGAAAREAAPDLKALAREDHGQPPPIIRIDRLGVVRSLIAIAPEDPDLLDLFASLPLANDDLAWAAEWLRSRGDAALPAMECVFRRQPVPMLAGLIAARGPAAHAALLRLLAGDPGGYVPRETLVTAMAEAGTIPPGAVPLVAKWFAEGLDRGACRWTAGFLARAGEAGEQAVMEAIGEHPWCDRRWWEMAESAPPEFVTRLSRLWLARHGAGIAAEPFAASPAGPRRTPALGGPGGGAFLAVADDGAALTGLSVTLGLDDMTLVVKDIVPLFGDAPAPWPDDRGRFTLRAPEGHVVLGLLVKWGNLVDGLALVCARLRDGEPDLRDLCLSRWAGGDGGSPARMLGGDGTRITGIHGRRGGLLDAIGLIGE